MVPENVALFFPVINFVSVDTPGVCGQGARIPVKTMRADAAAFIDTATALSVHLDGEPVRHMQRVQSAVFDVAVPEDNVFDAPCAPAGGVPEGIYFPSIDDGYYVRLNPLRPGPHTLRIHAETIGGFLVDVVYELMVVPISIDPAALVGIT